MNLQAKGGVHSHGILQGSAVFAFPAAVLIRAMKAAASAEVGDSTGAGGCCAAAAAAAAANDCRAADAAATAAASEARAAAAEASATRADVTWGMQGPSSWARCAIGLGDALHDSSGLSRAATSGNSIDEACNRCAHMHYYAVMQVSKNLHCIDDGDPPKGWPEEGVLRKADEGLFTCSLTNGLHSLPKLIDVYVVRNRRQVLSTIAGTSPRGSNRYTTNTL